MKNLLLPLLDKLLPRKRSIIETLLTTLKSEMGLEHSRHRPPPNAFVHDPLLPGGLLPDPSQSQHRHSRHPQSLLT